MIIGISGKIGSGKDTVAKIIQYITDYRNAGYTHRLSEDDFTSWKQYEEHHGHDTWEVKKFAGKLKQMVALLIGCKVEQLDNEEFKNTPLGPEWQHTFDGSMMNASEYAAMRTREAKGLLTPRLFLQLLGTEGLRDIIHPNVHINALFADYKDVNVFKVAKTDADLIPVYPNWLVPDTRFVNEANAIRYVGGVLLRIERASCSQGTHASETSLDYYPFDWVIYNNGTITDLILQVERFINEFKQCQR